VRLIRYGDRGEERPGIWVGRNVIDLWHHFPEMPDIGQAFFRDRWPDRIRDIKDEGRPLTERVGCPLSNPSKIICLGKNYTEHAREGNFDPPERPLIFCKTPNTLNGPYDPIEMPRSTGQVDWEVELAVVIGTGGKRIPKAEAMACVAGYMVMNDVSGREAQFRDSQWFRGKSFDTFAPMGPAVVTSDEIPNPHALRLTAKVDGRTMQDGTTADMIFDIPTLIADISEDITLTPGDVISTGTPAGVGIFRDPPVVLEAGNVVECEIEGIGTLVNPVI
jgi:2-keto-4-pentenoate hydratase/2-oxohepta-3-ene-1,7-dioic acid hydratase in catechol pathway